MFPLPHLRSGFRRRGQSNPTSPVPEHHQQSLWEYPALHEHPHSAQDASPRPDSRLESPNSSHMSPMLPPIARVTSSDTPPNFGSREDETSQDNWLAPMRSPRREDDVGFMGGVALANHRRTLQESPGPDITASTTGQPQARARVPPPPINTGIPYQRPAPFPTAQKASSSFITPTDLQQLSAEPKGKRPTGTRLASEPAILAHQLQALEVTKGRRGLSSLKDRFLMKRKPAPVTPEIGPVSPRLPQDTTFEYDPRIVGRRFHDFDNPNRKKAGPQPQTVAIQPARSVDHHDEPRTSQSLSQTQDVIRSTRQLEGHNTGAYSPEVVREDATLARMQLAAGDTNEHTIKHGHKRRQLSLDKALPREPSQSEQDVGHNSAEQTPAVSRQASAVVPRSASSARTVRSRNVSLSDPNGRDPAISAIPKHMKSTSSRFSFDMVGAAKQEKLLEEKHRQRQLEKGVDDSGFATKDRVSRFDDFDNDDYDYDAMMDDDGLEERIPGVNADAEDDDYPEEEIPGVNVDAEDDDYEEEEEEVQDELDPDNDQENFSGFVFQRSNPASAVTTPLLPDMLPTPRDPTGKVIGFAVTKDITPDLVQNPSPLYQINFLPGQTLGDSSEGLGIQGLLAQHQPAYDKPPYEGPPYEEPPYDEPPYEEPTFVDYQTVQSPEVPAPAPTRSDDLYYDGDFIDDGLRDELDFEPEGAPFDESLFDLNDTDQYGRPIPGAFAQAKSILTAQQEASNRQSDETSRMSGQSAVSQSTAHTSLDVGLQSVFPVLDNKIPGLEFPDQAERRSSVVPNRSSELAYQAALAEAAQKAAASGKFRRSSSPAPPDPHLMVTSPTDSTESHSLSHPENGVDFDDDDARGLDDDYDFDDDAIAEANAEALASDADGWYGREFGFYSAPMPVPSHHGQGKSAQSSTSPKPLSAENLFQYANGGYFGPAGGVVRSASGRMVSREPNLTPITERSEWSNRNSVMSFGNGPGGNANGGGAAAAAAREIQSPGLAKLAMMDDDDTNMSMSAFMRLRSKTFGSSKVSLLSSPEGSPRSEFSPAAPGASSPWGGPASFGAGGGGGGAYYPSHMRKGSSFSMQSGTSDGGGSGTGSPTLTMNVPPVPISGGGGGSGGGLAPSVFAQGQFSSTSPVLPGLSFPPVMEEDFLQVYGFPSQGGQGQVQGHGHTPDAPQLGMFPSETMYVSPTGTADDGLSPMSPASMQGYCISPERHSKRPVMGHRHKGSADSISYVKEEESGETRWVMERRRTAETGEVEVLEREVVRGGI